MKIVDCEQRSPKWYAAREECVITASEMGAFCVPDVAVTVDTLKKDLTAAGISFTSKDTKETLLKIVPNLRKYWGYTDGQKDARRAHINRKIAARTAYPEPLGEMSEEARREYDQWEKETRPVEYWLRRIAEAKERALRFDPSVNIGNLREQEAREAFTAATGIALHHVGFILHDDGFAGCSPDDLIKNEHGEWCAGYEGKAPNPETHLAYQDDPKLLLEDYKAQVHGSLAVTGLPVWNLWSYCPPYKPVHLTVARDAYTARMEVGLRELHADYARKWNKVLSEMQESQQSAA